MIFLTLQIACSTDKGISDTSVIQEEPDAYPSDIARECHSVVDSWTDPWEGIEFAALDEINRRRAEPADCRTQGTFEPAPPLEMDPYLQCSSRYHSYWMWENKTYEHDSPGGDLGDDPWQRMANAGFLGAPTGENIAFGYPTPSAAIEGWMNSDGHCAIIMNPQSTLAGVGFYQSADDYVYYWTLNTGQ